MTDDRGVTMWRAYWPVAVLAVTFLTVVVLFGTYLTARQHTAEARAEKQRRAICAILATIPGRIPPEIMRARIAFARPGRPRDCEAVTRPTAKHTPTPRPTPTPTATVVITSSLPRPAVTVTEKPRPTATRSPRPSPSPTPSPSQTCIPLTRICT